MKKTAIILLIISILSLYVFSVSIFADQTVTPFSPSYPQYEYQSGITWDNASSNALYLSATDGAFTPYTVEKQSLLFDWKATVDNVSYSCKTTTFSSVNMDGHRLNSINAHLPLLTLFRDYPIKNFHFLEFYFIVNVYAESEVIFTNKQFSGYVDSVLSEDNSADFREFDCALYAEGQSSPKSKFLIYKVQNISNEMNQLFTAAPDLGIMTIGNVPNGDDPFVANDDVIDIDIGFLSGSMGAIYEHNPYYLPELPDNWSIVGSIPRINRPPSDPDSSFGVVFNLLYSIDLVGDLLVPICLTAMGFFTFRLVLWKVV